jgi:O-methyltransferase
LAAVLEDCGVDKTLYLYDSFSGLPEFHENDQPHTTVHKRGDFATTQDILINNLSIFNIKKQIFAGWFNETIPTNLPNKICYAHLDGDLYDSIKIPLEHIYPRLVSGAICVIDDYDYNQFPGAKQATNEFLADKKEKLNTFCIKPTFSNVYHAYFQKL